MSEYIQPEPRFRYVTHYDDGEPVSGDNGTVSAYLASSEMTVTICGPEPINGRSVRFTLTLEQARSLAGAIYEVDKVRQNNKKLEDKA